MCVVDMLSGCILLVFSFLLLSTAVKDDDISTPSKSTDYDYPADMKYIGWEKFADNAKRKHTSTYECQVARIKCYEYRACTDSCALHRVPDGGFLRIRESAGERKDDDNIDQRQRVVNPCLEAVTACFGFEMDDIRAALRIRDDFQYWFQYEDAN